MKTIPLDGSDYEIEVAITRKNASTGATEAATGLTGLYGWISATEGGSEINATLKVALSERTSLAGTYYGIIDQSNLATQLAAYAGRVVHEVVSDGGNVKTSNPRRVTSHRAASE